MFAVKIDTFMTQFGGTRDEYGTFKKILIVLHILALIEKNPVLRYGVSLK